MDPTSRERRNPAPDEHPPAAPDDRHETNNGVELDDPALAAWLLARETELEEQAWAEADQFGEERWAW